MGFIGVTITDLSPNVCRMAHKSIESFLKFHDTKLIVYIIGDKELHIDDKRIEMIRIPKVDYNLKNIDVTNGEYFHKISDILVEKLLCFTRHSNCIFFENDVFFLDTMNDVWDTLPDGVSGHPCTYGALERTHGKQGVNSGLLFIKNYQLTYTLADIVKYFDENVSRWVDEEFLTNWIDISDIHHLTPDINVVQDQCIVKYKQPTWNPKSIHFTGLPKIYDDVLPHTVIKKFKLLYNPCIIAYLRQKIYKLLGS
jgi:hypothetical protein